MPEKQSMPIKQEGGQPSEMMRVNPLVSLRDELDRVFEDFMAWSPLRGGFFDRPPLLRRMMRPEIPSADIVEKDDCYQIDLDVPGIDKDGIEIALSGGSLVVQGSVNKAEEKKDGDYYLCERRHEAFSRAFTLPPGVDPEKIEADLKNGVLTIMLPKTEEAQKKARRIEVKEH